MPSFDCKIVSVCLRVHTTACLSIQHIHTFTITCTCCYDEIKGTQDLKIYLMLILRFPLHPLYNDSSLRSTMTIPTTVCSAHAPLSAISDPQQQTGRREAASAECRACVPASACFSPQGCDALQADRLWEEPFTECNDGAPSTRNPLDVLTNHSPLTFRMRAAFTTHSLTTYCARYAFKA